MAGQLRGEGRSGLPLDLQQAARQPATATLQVAGRQLEGTLKIVGPNLFFEGHVGNIEPRSGETVEVVVATSTNRLSFMTVIVSNAEGRLFRLDPPRLVQRRPIRATARRQMGDDPRFALWIGGAGRRLHDLSEGGLAFFLEDEDHALRSGSRCRARLRVPGQSGIPVLLEIRHIREAGDDVLAGASFLALNDRYTAILRRALYARG